MIFAGGNVSEKLVKALRAGYQERCGAYILLMKNPMAITQLLHSGDDFRIINTEARYDNFRCVASKSFVFVLSI